MMGRVLRAIGPVPLTVGLWAYLVAYYLLTAHPSPSSW